MEATSQNLSHHFRTALSQPLPTGHLDRVIWRLIVGHPWYQDQLKRIAQHLARYQSGLVFSEDIEQEAILLLARSLKRSPDLKFKPCQPDEQFSRWMRRIIFRDCRQALRRLCRGQEMESLTDQPMPEDAQFLQGLRLDVRSGLELLPPKERFIIEQYLLGQSFDETASQLKVSPATVCRRYQRALYFLQQFLH